MTKKGWIFSFLLLDLRCQSFNCHQSLQAFGRVFWMYLKEWISSKINERTTTTCLRIGYMLILNILNSEQFIQCFFNYDFLISCGSWKTSHIVWIITDYCSLWRLWIRQNRNYKSFGGAIVFKQWTAWTILQCESTHRNVRECLNRKKLE